MRDPLKVAADGDFAVVHEHRVVDGLTRARKERRGVEARSHHNSVRASLLTSHRSLRDLTQLRARLAVDVFAVSGHHSRRRQGLLRIGLTGPSAPFGTLHVSWQSEHLK